MKMLFVLYDYLPSGSAEANLLSKLIVSMKKYGFSVDVLTTKSNLSQKDIEEHDRTRIFRVVSSRAISIRKSLKQSGFIRIAAMTFEKIYDIIIEKYPKNFLIKSVINNFYLGFQNFNLNDYDVIIPVCAYYETYTATKKYVKKHNIKSCIVVYQIDPLSGNSSYSDKSYKNRLQMEVDMSKTASAIITTDIIKNEKKALKIDSDKVFSLEFPSVTDMTNNSSSFSRNAEIKCVFSGYIHKKIRDPEYTFRLFSKFSSPKIILYIIGAGSEEILSKYKATYPERFIQVGIVSLDKSFEYIKNADILVNIGNNVTNFVPSKIFDYISTGKPIINFYKNKDCPTLEYFKKYDNAISVHEDIEHIDDYTECVESFINERVGKKLSYEQIEKDFRQCTADYVAHEFYKIIMNELQ